MKHRGFNKWTPKQRRRAVWKWFKAGKKPQQIASLLKMPVSEVQRLIKQVENSIRQRRY